MKLDHIPGDLVDGLFGDEATRIALENSAPQITEIEFSLSDGTGDCTDMVRELERAELQEWLCGVTVARVAGGSVQKALRDGRGRRWLAKERRWSEPWA